MENIKAVLFDLDGVLVFTDQFHYQAWKQIADSMGIYFDEEINNQLRGVSRMESLEIILKGYEGVISEDEKLILAEEKNTIYRELLMHMTPEDVTKETRDTLAKLKDAGYQLAIGSSSKNARFILEKVELMDYFEAISDGNNITNSKPDPEVFIKAAGFLNVDPKDCIVVEDAFAGIDAAKAGGMYAAAIGDAVRYEKVDVVLHSFSDLLHVLGLSY